MSSGAGVGWIVAVYGPLLFAVALGSCAGLLVLLRSVLTRYAIARVNARSSHTTPTPQGAGIGVAAGTLAAVLLALMVVPGFGQQALTELIAVGCGALLLAVLGGIDDVRGVPVAVRLPLQVIAVGMVILALPGEARLFPALPYGIERGLLVAGGLWFVNLVNFMDGIDWITVAECVPVAGALILLGVLGALPLHGAIVAVALLGALVGFAPFNKPPASMFLGDIGSLPLGLVLGWLLAHVAFSGHLIGALLLPLYYLADATITLLLRIAAGERIWRAHRSHFYQRATDRGLSVLQIDARIFALNMVLAALAVASVVSANAMIRYGALALGGGAVAWVLAGFARRPR